MADNDGDGADGGPRERVKVEDDAAAAPEKAKGGACSIL